MDREVKQGNLVFETAQNKKYSYGDYLHWSDGRYEIIDGQAYLLSPGPSRRHQEISGEIFRQLANYLAGKKCRVYHAPFDIRLAAGEEKDEEISTVVQPDLAVICDRGKLDERGCKGAPDLIVEIISPASGGRDRKIKRSLYEQHGIKEYWLVDGHAKTVEVYLLSNHEYSKPQVYLEEERVPVKILFDLEIDLKPVFAE